jgi:outer membrane lipoprotein LolB
VAALLVGCATRPAATPSDISGRLSVRIAAHAGQAERNVGTVFDLRGDERNGELQLSTPLGNTVALASWTPEGAELRTSDGQAKYPDLDTLTRELLGEALPVAALFDWLNGRPWPGAPSAPRDGGFEQLGWQVDLARHAEGWVVAERPQPPAITVRVRLAGAS